MWMSLLAKVLSLAAAIGGALGGGRQVAQRLGEG